MWVRKIHRGRKYWLKRLPRIISLRNQGLTLWELGRRFSCSGEWIRLLLPVEMRRRFKEPKLPIAPRYCVWCGKLLPKRRWKFCSDQCYKDYNTQWKEINRKGYAAYQHRQELKKKRGGICEAS